MDERIESSSVPSSTLKKRLQSYISRSSSFNKYKTSPDVKNSRVQSKNTSTEHSLVLPHSSEALELLRLPETFELAFYVAYESSADIREIWDVLVTAYLEQNSKIVEPDESLGQHAHVVFNSTPSQFMRLGRVIDAVKERFKAQYDSHCFMQIANFFKHEKTRFYEVIQHEAKIKRWSVYDNINRNGVGMFDKYVRKCALTSLELDGVFNGRNSHLPKCIFTIENLEKLCLSNNNLRLLPADIGRLSRLKYLRLSHNRLKNDSIPYTLCFCAELDTLLLDHNSLDAIPGFVLKLKHLQTLHRHGNQNYFRTTFMWYVCESRERIRTASFSDVDMAQSALNCATSVQSLQFWAARVIISSKANYFKIKSISESTKDFISEAYKMFNICAACKTANLLHQQGYFVFTFRNPFLGNTCVPFQHWTCSKECAIAVEVPARREQVRMLRQQQQDYARQIKLYISPAQTIEEQPETAASSNNLFCGGQTSSRRPARRSGCTIL